MSEEPKKRGRPPGKTTTVDNIADTQTMIGETKIIYDEEIRRLKKKQKNGDLDRQDRLALSKLTDGLKKISQEEREWESLYGVANWTDEKLKDETVIILKKFPKLAEELLGLDEYTLSPKPEDKQ